MNLESFDRKPLMIVNLFFINLNFIQKNTVTKWIKRYREENTVETHYNLCHRPRKTSNVVDQQIVEAVRSTPFITVSSFTGQHNISYSTIRRRLHENALYNYIPARQTLLTQQHRENRIRFCEENYGRDWDNIIFSDEKTFKSYSDRAMSLWRPRGERYNPKYVQSVRMSGRITCGVWAYITAFGPGEICKISRNMDSDEYTSILEQIYIPTMNMMFGTDANEFTFMQDNARIHTSQVARAWFRAHPEIIQLQWPAYSPDLNPIENVWAKMVYNWPQQGNTLIYIIFHYVEN